MTMVPLANQTGGHDGILTSEDKSILFKPASKQEIDFYSLLGSDPHLFELKEWTPTVLGSLKVTAQLAPGEQLDEAHVATTDANQPEHLVIENLSHPFTAPCVVDIKLGTVLYAPEATEDKKNSMIKSARESTSLELGMRITAYTVWDRVLQITNSTPKGPCRILTPTTLNTTFLPDYFKLQASPASPGLSKDLLLRVLSSIIAQAVEIREILEKVEIRMIGGSLLVLYEGDIDMLTEGFQKEDEFFEKQQNNTGGDDDVENDEGDSDEEDEKGPPPTVVVRLIDFAHTRVVEGEGPDEGVVLGLKSWISLLEGYRDVIEMGQS